MVRAAIEQEARDQGLLKLRETLSNEPHKFGAMRSPSPGEGTGGHFGHELSNRVGTYFAAWHEYRAFGEALFASGEGSRRGAADAAARAEELWRFTEQWPTLERLASMLEVASERSDRTAAESPEKTDNELDAARQASIQPVAEPDLEL